jgi:tetraacyldisaccharide 4'-kinase
MIRPFALLVPLYAAAVGAKNSAYDRAWIKPHQLAWPVVSVGNLSVGGAGKTPLVIHLAQLLASQNINVDVLSRGYGRTGSAVERVDPEGNASRYGDEPLLIARSAKAPVYVGADRYQAGQLAERDALVSSGVHLLDDGFQHRKLGRAMDIVVVRADDFREGLLPAGRLREPLTSLRRASAIVLRAEDRELESELRRRDIVAPVWIQHRNLAVEPTSKAVTFCGIARPEEFFAALRAQNVDLLSTVALRDHQPYTDENIERLTAMLRRHGAACFVTTEKDAARLTPEQRAALNRIAPLHIARLEVSLENEDAIVARLLGLSVRK